MAHPFTMELKATAESVGRARSVARRYFDGRGTGVLLDIELAVSELVTNAIRHGGGGIDLRLEFDNGSAVVAVHDDGADMPVMRDVDRGSPGGRGLRIVEQLSTEWGTYSTDRGKTVWCRIAADSDGNQKAVHQ